jgi:preprotein translocase subunit SecA
MLATIDERWTDHLGNLEQIDDAVGLRGYAQLDPLLEFKREAHQLYQAMVAHIQTQTIEALFNVLSMSDRGVAEPGAIT